MHTVEAATYKPRLLLPKLCVLALQRLEKLNRVKVVEKERASLESAKMEAQALLGALVTELFSCCNWFHQLPGTHLTLRTV